MAAQDARFDVQGTPHATHLVFEEQPQGLDHFELHEVGQTAHVVVALDGGRRSSCGTHRLDDVGVNGPLPQPPRALHLVRRLVEHLDEHATNGLALGLGIGLSSKRREELISRANASDVEPHVLVVFKDLFEFVLAEQAVVDEDAVQAIDDGPVQEFRRRRIYAAAQSEDDAVIAADFGLQIRHSGFHKIVRGPRALAAADAHHKVLEQDGTFSAVPNLRVELNPPHVLARGAKACVLDV